MTKLCSAATSALLAPPIRLSADTTGDGRLLTRLILQARALPSEFTNTALVQQYDSMALHFVQAGSGETVYVFSHMIVVDTMASLLKGFATLAVLVTLVYSRPYAGARDMLRAGDLFTLSLYSGQMCTTSQAIIVPAGGIATDEGHKSYDEFCADLARAIERFLSKPEVAHAVLGAIRAPARSTWSTGSS